MFAETQYKWLSNEIYIAKNLSLEKYIKHLTMGSSEYMGIMIIANLKCCLQNPSLSGVPCPDRF